MHRQPYYDSDIWYDKNPHWGHRCIELYHPRGHGSGETQASEVFGGVHLTFNDPGAITKMLRPYYGIAGITKRFDLFRLDIAWASDLEDVYRRHPQPPGGPFPPFPHLSLLRVNCKASLSTLEHRFLGLFPSLSILIIGGTTGDAFLRGGTPHKAIAEALIRLTSTSNPHIKAVCINFDDYDHYPREDDPLRFYADLWPRLDHLVLTCELSSVAEQYPDIEAWKVLHNTVRNRSGSKRNHHRVTLNVWDSVAKLPDIDVDTCGLVLAAYYPLSVDLKLESCWDAPEIMRPWQQEVLGFAKDSWKKLPRGRLPVFVISLDQRP